MSKQKKTNHPVSNRHFRQVICRGRATAESMLPLLAVSWRPGDQSGSFLGKVFRPIGSPLMVVQHSEFVDVKGRPRERVHLLGYKAEIDPVKGDVYFGGEERNVFSYDFGLRPHVNAKGRILDPKKNPSLGFLGLEMDKIRQNYAERSFTARSAPLLPRIFLAFPQDRLPEMVDSHMVRARVARHMRRAVEEIDAMDPSTRRPFLEAEWHSCFIMPGEQGNDTNLALINEEATFPADDPENKYAVRVTQALRVYECFEELLGAEIYNPARELISPRKAVPNVTKQVVKDLGLDYDKAVHGGEEGDDELGIALEKGVREALGANAALCSTEDIVDMILNPEQSFVPSGINDLADLSEEQVVSLMREAVGRHAECCTDGDLVAAAHAPNKPLFARGLCGVSVVRFDPARKPDSLRFGPAELSRQRTHVDLSGVKSYWKAGRKRRGKKAHAVTN